MGTNISPTRGGLYRKIFFLFLLCSLTHLKVLSQETAAATHWISANDLNSDSTNTWIAFRKDVQFKDKPRHAFTTISADTKYWLWINGKLIIFEGGLKRGPNPYDSYCDKIDLGPYLSKGNNKIAVLLWHFGKSGFSHVSSGKSGLFFHMQTETMDINSDQSWLSRIHPAYQTADNPLPNFRLPESNIRFDARNDILGWQTQTLGSLSGFSASRIAGKKDDAPWNKLIDRPIPQWKDYGVKKISFKRVAGREIDTITAILPYNMQCTPILDVFDRVGGHTIRINTDHSYAGGTNNIRAEYITKKGKQTYESLGWMNGEKLILLVPKIVKIKRLNYRETGYDSENLGKFTCSDPFYNRYWKKASRTLYVNMRDNFFDCPDRERAQWWGDVVLLMGEAFYTYSPSSHALMRKAIDEICNWQRESGVLHSPIPGNFNQELPDQMLTSIGNYGFWNYYMQTGDSIQIRKAYPAVKKYLQLWKTDETGLTELRNGDWLWGDWGENKDIRLIMAGWHYIALDAAAKMAELLGQTEDVQVYRNTMVKVKNGYNQCWNGQVYRHPAHKGNADDRVQALAVIANIADRTKYGSILKCFKSQYYASPYMEKYIMEALFKMEQGNYALARTKDRFSEMVNDPERTTLYEGWGIGERGFGGGTTNHAWSGGAQIVLTEYVFGIKPLLPGYTEFAVQPQPASLSSGYLSIPTVKGNITTSFRNDKKGFRLKLKVPNGSTAILKIHKGSPIILNNKAVIETEGAGNDAGYTTFTLTAGDYDIRRKLPL